MEDNLILNIFKEVDDNPEYSNPLDKTLLNIKMQGEMSNFMQKNKRRRSKKDKNGRIYHCGCGKKYLSYPALYTHIKNKHNGVPPSGTTKQPLKRLKAQRKNKSARLSIQREDSSMTMGTSGHDSESNQDGNTDRDSNLSTSNLNDFSPFKNGKFKKSTAKSKIAKIGEKLFIPSYIGNLFQKIPKSTIRAYDEEIMLHYQDKCMLKNFNEEGQLFRNKGLINQKKDKDSHPNIAGSSSIKFENAPVNPSTSFPKHLNQITSTFNLHPFVKYFQSLDSNSDNSA